MGLFQGGRIGGTLVIALIMAGFTLFQYYAKSSQNEITGETQHVDMTAEEEIAIGLQSTPSMIQEYGGLYRDPKLQNMVTNVGTRLIKNSVAKKSPYQYQFHLLADQNSINAFALPGGQVFITYALLSKLETEDQLAGVLGHEIGHVIARHSAERIADQALTEGLSGAVVIATGTQQSAQMAQMVSNMINMKYGRGQELQSDELGVRFMLEAGYDPDGMTGVMKILEEAGKGNEQPEFSSTHPSPENRIQRIQEAIEKYGHLKNTKGDSPPQANN